MDIYEELANFVMAIRSDQELSDCFIKVLEVNTYTGETRVEKLAEEVAKLNPPKLVTRLLSLLKDDKIAAIVQKELLK